MISVYFVILIFLIFPMFVFYDKKETKGEDNE